MAFHEAGVELATTEFRIAQDFLVVRGGGLHALHTHVVQGAQAAVHGFFPGQRPDHQLQAHGVVERRDGVAGVDRRVGAHARAARGVVAGDLAEAGQEVVLRVFSVDPELQGETTVLDVFLLDRQWQAGRDADLLAHDVDAGDFFGDGVFHLHPGVHLHEVHLALGEQELHGAGVFVTDRLGRAHRQVADVGALFRGELRARGDFDQLLVTALDRAVTLEQVHHIAEAVAKNLGFDVFRVDDAFFQEDFRRAEGLGRFGNDPGKRLFQFFTAVAAANAAAATAGSGLEHHRITDAITFLQGLVDVRHIAFGARGDRYAGLDHAAPGFGLVAHAANDFGGRADELDPALGADIRQFGVFRQEPVTGVQRITTGFHCQVHQLARVQVTGKRLFTDAVSLVGALDVQGMTIGVGVDRHRANAHLGAGPHDSDRDFTPVGDQDFFYHWSLPKAAGTNEPATPVGA